MKRKLVIVEFQVEVTNDFNNFAVRVKDNKVFFDNGGEEVRVINYFTLQQQLLTARKG